VVVGMTDPKSGGLVVDALVSAMEHGAANLDEVPRILRRILDEDLWRFYVNAKRVEVRHERFADFVTARWPDGLGTTVETLRNLVRGDLELVDLLDRALPGRQGARTDLVDVINEVAGPDGTSQAAALRRLRKDAPGLHADVIAGRLSAHAAMVAAGFRRPTATVRTDDPAAFVRAGLRYFTADQIRAALGDV
jgi:hypothetical protein